MISDHLAATLLDASPDGMLVVDGAGRIRLANRAAHDLFGRPPGGLVDVVVDELVPSEYRGRHAGLRSAYVDAPATRPMGSGPQLFGEHADGSLFPVEISLSPVELDGDPYTIATVRDVSARRRDAAQIELLHDRERIARDLHDLVIQRLFGAGLGLQAVHSTAEPPLVRDRISEVIDELDTTIREVREAIFGLSVQPNDVTLSERIRSTVDDRGRAMGFSPVLGLGDDIDTVPPEVAEQLLATLGEALSNVARHAQASFCEVTVSRVGDRLHMSVRDDGVGLPESIERRGGLVNMADRAGVLGGSCTVTPASGSGTAVEWTVPV